MHIWMITAKVSELGAILWLAALVDDPDIALYTSLIERTSNSFDRVIRPVPIQDDDVRLHVCRHARLPNTSSDTAAKRARPRTPGVCTNMTRDTGRFVPRKLTASVLADAD